MVLANLELRLQEARTNQLDFNDFFELLIDDELNTRQNRKMQRSLKKADFRNLKTLEDFDWQFNPNIERKTFLELASCQFIRDAHDLLLIGPPGTGKTHLAQAVGYAAIKAATKAKRNRPLPSWPLHRVKPGSRDLAGTVDDWR